MPYKDLLIGDTMNRKLSHRVTGQCVAKGHRIHTLPFGRLRAMNVSDRHSGEPIKYAFGRPGAVEATPFNLISKPRPLDLVALIRTGTRALICRENSDCTGRRQTSKRGPFRHVFTTSACDCPQLDPAPRSERVLGLCDLGAERRL